MTHLGKAYTPVHPGEILKDELAYRKISQKKFAEIIGVSYPMLNEILNCKRPVTTGIAMLVEAALGIKAYILVNIQTDYDLDTTAVDNKIKMRMQKIRTLSASLALG